MTKWAAALVCAFALVALVFVAVPMQAHAAGSSFMITTTAKDGYEIDHWTGSTGSETAKLAANVQLTSVLTGRAMTDGQYAYTISDVAVTDGTADDAATKLGIKAGDEYATTARADGETWTRGLLENIVFTADDAGKTYSFVVKETTASTTTGYTSDAPAGGYKVELAVSYDKDTNVLTVVATRTALDANGDPLADATPTSVTWTSADTEMSPLTVPFAHTYSASGTADIKAQKYVFASYSPGEQTFNFTFKPLKGTGSDLKASATVDVRQGTLTTTDLNFGTIYYDLSLLAEAEGQGYAVKTVDATTGNATWTLTYVAAEDTTGFAEAGITAMKQSFTVTVTVTDDGMGMLDTSVAWDGNVRANNDARFQNYFYLLAQIYISGTKVLAGADGIDAGLVPDIAGKYTFTLTGVEWDEATQQYVTDADAPLPKGAEDGKATAQNVSGGSINFNYLTIMLSDVARKLGITVTDDMDDETILAAIAEKDTDGDGLVYVDFYYKVEESGSVAGVINDEDADRILHYRVSVNTGTVDSSKKFRMGSELVDENGATVNGPAFTFTNTLSVTSVTPTLEELELDVTKKIEGRDLTESDVFTFELLSTDGSSVVATGTNDATGKASMTLPEYTQPGTYYYKLVEKGAGTTGQTVDRMTNSTQVYNVVVTVAADYDNAMESGVPLVATARIESTDGTATFTNIYNPDSPGGDNNGGTSGDTGGSGGSGGSSSKLAETGDTTVPFAATAFACALAALAAAGFAIRKRQVK